MAKDFDAIRDASTDTGGGNSDTSTDFSGDLASDAGIDLNDDVLKHDGTKRGAAKATLMSYMPPPPPPEFLEPPPAIVEYVDANTIKTPEQLTAELQESVQGIAEGVAEAGRRRREAEENEARNSEL